MARITGFEKTTHASRLHPTKTECEWSSLENEGQRYLQISSHGSGERQGSGVTQTYQLDVGAARQLLEIMRTTFPELR